jgi:rfaE bifunctional protein kinase chain/domain/rfaE bifunctional protein nucleotidyltransferase chain/domain
LQANSKIKGIEELAEILAPRRQGKKIVHCHGVFDLLHIGHIRHLEQAKKLGDILIVTITPDRHVNKGPHRPAFNEDLRAEAIAALGCVDHVAINKWPMAIEAIKLLQPNFYVKGADHRECADGYDGSTALEEAAIKSVGGQVVFTDDITFSSSNLINRYLPVFPKEVGEYLADFPARYCVDDVLGYLQSARSLKVLVVGETIIDEYLYCRTIGKSGKEPILAAQYMHAEKFAGGILAVANHIAAFCDQVRLLTFLGEHDSQEAYIREKLDAKIDKTFLCMEDAPTIVKRRFVEIYPFQKLFELYIMDDGEGTAARSEKLCATLREMLPAYDVVIVTDYGHGMFSQEVVDILCNQARFLAVNTQANAGNLGFNTISKYHRADYICISERELRLDVRSQRATLHGIVQKVAERLSCQRATITRGREGCLSYSQEEGFFEIPAFTSRIVDRVGAGDAVFAVTSLCVAQQAPMEIVGFIGNAVGAQSVVTVGHRKPIEREPLLGCIESLLK